MPSLPADARRALVVFSAGGQEFRVAEVLATLAPDPTASALAPGADVDAALAAWRYQRDLVSAEECEAWLAQRGLEYADLAEWMARQSAGIAPDPESDDIDALLGERFDPHARELAAHAAICSEVGNGLLDPLPDAWPRWQAEASEFLARSLNATLRERTLAQHSVALTRMDFTLVEFDSLAAAREARMCAEHDGLSLAQVAAEHGFPERRIDALAETLAPAMTSALQHALPGQVCLATLADECIGLMQLHARSAPSLDDPQVAARIEAILRTRVFDALISRHVRWNWPLHRS